MFVAGQPTVVAPFSYAVPMRAMTWVLSGGVAAWTAVTTGPAGSSGRWNAGSITFTGR